MYEKERQKESNKFHISISAQMLLCRQQFHPVIHPPNSTTLHIDRRRRRLDESQEA